MGCVLRGMGHQARQDLSALNHPGDAESGSDERPGPPFSQVPCEIGLVTPPSARVEWGRNDTIFLWLSNADFDLFTDASGSGFGLIRYLMH